MKNKLERNENHGKVILKTIEMAYISSAITISVISYTAILDFSLLFNILKRNIFALNILSSF